MTWLICKTRDMNGLINTYPFQDKQDKTKLTAQDKTEKYVPDDSVQVLRKDGKEIITLRKDADNSDSNRTFAGNKSKVFPVTKLYNETENDAMTKVDITSDLKLKHGQNEELMSKHELRLQKASRPILKKPPDAHMTDTRRITVLPL